MKPTTPTERAAYITWLICYIGLAMTTEEVARKCGLTYFGAWRLLNRVARVAPIYDDAGVWRRCE